MPKLIKKLEPTAFDPIVKAFSKDPKVAKMRMFGSDGLRVRGKVFAFYWKGTLVLKLSEERVAGLVKSKKGKLFDPGHGRTSPTWIAVSPKALTDWRKLSREAYAFVSEN